MDDALESELADLQLALALGPKEAGAVRDEVISATYRRAAQQPADAACTSASCGACAVLRCRTCGTHPCCAAAQAAAAGGVPQRAAGGGREQGGDAVGPVRPPEVRPGRGDGGAQGHLHRAHRDVPEGQQDLGCGAQFQTAAGVAAAARSCALPACGTLQLDVANWVRWCPPACAEVHTSHTRASRIPADEEEQELATLRKLLCLPKEAVADIDTATKGRIFRTAVQSALGAGIDGFTQARSASIVQAQEGCVCVDPAPCCQRKANVPDLLMWRECPDCRRTARRCGRRGRRCGCPSTWPRRSSRTPPASAHAKAAVAEPQRQN